MKETAQKKKFSSKNFLIASIDVFMISVFCSTFLFFLIGTTGLTLQGHTFDRQVILLFGMLTAFVFFVFRGFLQGRLEIPKTLIDIPLLFFVGTLFCSAFLSADVWHSLWGLWGSPGRGVFAWLASIILFYLVLHFIRIGREKWVFFSFLFGVVGVALWYAFVLFLFPLFTFDESVSFFLQDEAKRVFVLAFLPLVLGMIVQFFFSEGGKGKKRKMFFLTLPLISILFLLIYFSRDISWGILLSVMGAWLFLILPTTLSQHARYAWFPLLIFALVIMGYFSGSLFPQEEKASQQKLEFSDSITIMQSTLNDHFFLGVGPSLYGQAFSLYRPLDLNQKEIVLSRLSEGGGLVYELPVTLGVLGTCAFVFLFLFFVGSVFFTGFDGKKEHLFIWIGSLIACVVLLWEILFVSSQGVLIVVWFFVLALVFSLAKSDEQRKKDIRILSLRPSSEYLLSAAFIALLFLGTVGYVSFSLAQIFLADVTAKRATDTSFYDDSLDYLKKSIALNPWEGKYYFLLAQYHEEFLRERKWDKENAEELLEMENTINTVSEYITKGKAKMPKDVISVEMTAQMYETLSAYVSDFIEVSKNTYQEATLLEPNNPRLYVKAGEMIIRQAIESQDPQEKKRYLGEAKKVLETALSKKEEYPQAWYLLALVQEGSEEIEGALGSILRALLYAPKDAGALRLLARLYESRDQEGDDERAKKAYEQSIASNPEDPSGYFALAQMYKNTMQYGDALRYYSLTLAQLKEDSDETFRARVEKERDEVLRKSTGGNEEQEEQEENQEKLPEEEALEEESKENGQEVIEEDMQEVDEEEVLENEEEK